MGEPERTESERAARLAADLRGLVGRMKRRLRAEGGAGDLTPSQVAVLLRLERDGPQTVTALARAEGVRPQSMGATVAGLQAADLVSGEADPSDGRQTILSLTPACAERIRAGRAARQDWLARTIRGALSPDEQRQLAAALKLIERLADS